MHPDYDLLMDPPPLADYVRLRRDTGLSPTTEEQARLALRGGWVAGHVTERSTDEVVGMGRVIGDGGWYFHLIDMAVLPAHQRRGIGDAILTALLDQVRQRAPAGAYVNLLADPPGRHLYERHGFQPTAPRSVGMSMRT